MPWNTKNQLIKPLVFIPELIFTSFSSVASIILHFAYPVEPSKPDFVAALHETLQERQSSGKNSATKPEPVKIDQIEFSSEITLVEEISLRRIPSAPAISHI